LASSYYILQGDQQIGVVSITYFGPYFFSENDFAFINALNSALLVAGVLAALLSLAIGGLLARRIARPIAKTAHIATRIAQGDYDVRFESRTNTRELKELAGAINHLAGELAKQESLRKQLTSDVAHELRTPLSAVSSHLEAMISGLWETTPARLQACHQELQRIGRLVADIEQLARVEGENLQLKTAPVDLLTLANLVAENMTAEAAKKDLTLQVKGAATPVKADKERLLQALTNLVSNAIKYTPEGGHVSLEVSATAQEGLIKVTDNGIGIPEQELPLIFERFYRTDKSRNRKTGGAGIGLTIASSIIAAHGGTITADSRVGQGSCFTITLPQNC
jgi:signal transduction histidine kinase